jgi:hypothetical protein|tara:strand:+ start:366 stop:578 length:213 start_codon:yes stop_codon:yes gene_type:complete
MTNPHTFYMDGLTVGYLTAAQVCDTYEGTNPNHHKPGWYYWVVEEFGIDCLQGPFGTEAEAVAEAQDWDD